jgi:hypothetical protein
MANWPALVVILVIVAGGAAAGAFVFLVARQVVRRVRSRRNIAAATTAHEKVMLPPPFPFPAHLALRRPLVPAAAPSQLMAPSALGRHSYEHLNLDPPTEQLIAVPAPTATVQPVTPPRGHRAATPDHPANAPRTSDSDGHHPHRRVAAGTPAGARLTTSPR